MKAVIQRVKSSRVLVDEKTVSSIGPGLLILLGIGRGDNEDSANRLAQRIASLRIFEDEQGKMNLSLLDIKGEGMVVSQFTLYGDTAGGRRPSFTDAEEPARAKVLYEYFIEQFKKLGVATAQGIFGARMQVILQNDGPVTLIIKEGDAHD